MIDGGASGVARILNQDGPIVIIIFFKKKYNKPAYYYLIYQFNQKKYDLPISVWLIHNKKKIEIMWSITISTTIGIFNKPWKKKKTFKFATSITLVQILKAK